MTTENNSKLEEDFPSVELAYPIAIASYDAMAKRIDTVDGRIQTLTAFAVTACLAVPTLGKSQNLSLDSIWFELGMSVLVLATAVSTYARLTGKVRILHPAKLWEDALHLPTATFKTYAISYAAKAFEANNAQLERKWRYSVAVTFLYALALVMLVVWAGTGRPT